MHPRHPAGYSPAASATRSASIAGFYAELPPPPPFTISASRSAISALSAELLPHAHQGLCPTLVHHLLPPFFRPHGAAVTIRPLESGRKRLTPSSRAWRAWELEPLGDSAWCRVRSPSPWAWA